MTPGEHVSPSASDSPKRSRIPASLTVFAVSLCALVRVLVGCSRHSGQDNHHGAATAYGGDAEAQRHWMELTYHLPIGQWYHHDLEYWGLDYPPLTAYASYLCGALAHAIVGPHAVALHESRYREMDLPTKAYMRATVIALDLGLYATAVWWILKDRNLVPASRHLHLFGAALMQPALLLIDHGHFQYNTTALGLALWSFYFITQPTFCGCVMGSVLFVAALSFKQMTLYYAPAVFGYLLARCLKSRAPLRRFVTLGLTVVATLALLWWPFVVYGPDELSLPGRLKHVLRRIFPLQRGLFESKVSNLWCVLSLKPIRIRERLSAGAQPLAALLATSGLMLPSCVALYRQADPKAPLNDQRDLIFRGTAACATSFFLASFQVHEKSLLIALAPASLLEPSLSIWFGIVTAWTLWPLLVLDRLEAAYCCTMLLFLIVVTQAPSSSSSSSQGKLQFYWMWLKRLSYGAMIAMHVLEVVAPAPPRLPDLYPVLWSVVGCALVGCTWLRLSGQLVVSMASNPAVTKVKAS